MCWSTLAEDDAWLVCCDGSCALAQSLKESKDDAVGIDVNVVASECCREATRERTVEVQKWRRGAPCGGGGGGGGELVLDLIKTGML